VKRKLFILSLLLIVFVGVMALPPQTLAASCPTACTCPHASSCVQNCGNLTGGSYVECCAGEAACSSAVQSCINSMNSVPGCPPVCPSNW